jgi:uncharacterized protein
MSISLLLPSWGVMTGAVMLAGALAVVSLDVLEGLRRRRLLVRQHRLALSIFQEHARLDFEAVARERLRRDASWEGLRKFKIDRKVIEAEDTCSFYLRPHDGKPLPPFDPGQHLTFQLKIPGQPKPVIRCYSLSDSPLETEYYRVTIKRIMPPPTTPDLPPGLASSFFHSLDVGALLDVRAPAGNFYLDRESNRPVVLIAGGVGLTPLLSMLNTINRTESKRETWFIYAVVNRRHHAMYDHLNLIACEHHNVRVVAVYSSPTESCVHGRDYQEKGFVDVTLLQRLLPSNNYEFYICGPPPMMEGIIKGLHGWGVPESDIRFEAFGSQSVKATRGPQSPILSAGPAQIDFTRSGKTVAWKTTDSSVLDVAEANGIVIDSGCRSGNCGTCETAIRWGSVSYPITPGFKIKDGTCLACIAVPQGSIAVDA